VLVLSLHASCIHCCRNVEHVRLNSSRGARTRALLACPNLGHGLPRCPRPPAAAKRIPQHTLPQSRYY
jgi:hypothetical protein